MMALRGVLLLGILVASCGRDIAFDLHPSANARPRTEADAGTKKDAEVPTDAGVAFCSGADKVVHGATIVQSVLTTTADRPMASCCQTIAIRLHTIATLGFDLEVLVWAWTWLEPGEHALAMQFAPGTVAAQIHRAPSQNITFPPENNLSGTVHVTTSGDSSQSFQLGICAAVIDRSDPLFGTKVYVESTTVMPPDWHERLGIWLLDGNIDARRARSMPLNALPLRRYPMIGLTSIAYYRLSEHRVGLSQMSAQGLVNQIPPAGLGGVPFVLQADGVRIYLGAFASWQTSIFQGPFIRIDTIADEGFTIENGAPGMDQRPDHRIITVLDEAGKLLL